MQLYTIGFSGKSAEQFFNLLRGHKVRRVIDVRLKNRSQLAGFTKQQDLPFFLRELAGADYLHAELLAPDEALLSDYRKGRIDAGEWESRYRALLKRRKVEDELDRKQFDRACLLCAEPEATHCHRRLAAEHLKEKWGRVTITHL